VLILAHCLAKEKGLFIYLTPFVSLSLRGIKGDGEEKERGASAPLKRTVM
jgi:hypothetical protein